MNDWLAMFRKFILFYDVKFHCLVNQFSKPSDYEKSAMNHFVGPSSQLKWYLSMRWYYVYNFVLGRAIFHVHCGNMSNWKVRNTKMLERFSVLQQKLIAENVKPNQSKCNHLHKNWGIYRTPALKVSLFISRGLTKQTLAQYSIRKSELLSISC